MSEEHNPLDDWTAYAQDKLNSPNWFPYKFERVVGGILLIGAECPLKRDGKPNFRKKNRDTIQTVVYPIDD